MSQSPAPEEFEEVTMDMVRDLEREERERNAPPPSEGQDPKHEGQEEEEEELDILGSGAITKKVIKKGQSESRPVQGQEVDVVATCWVDGNAVYENRLFTLRVGEGDVSMAWDIIIPLMDVGEIAECKSSYRFDKQPSAKADSSITYRLELRAVRDTKSKEEMTIDERLKEANAKKTRGNEYFRLNDLESAAASFKRAIDLLKVREEDETSPRKQELESAIIPCWNNLALVQIKAESYAQAFESLDNVLKIEPTNEKAIFRRAKCYFAKKDYDDAIAELDKIASSQDPSVHELRKEVNDKKRMQDQEDKKLYTKMVSALDGSSPDVIKRDKEIEEERRKKKEMEATASEKNRGMVDMKDPQTQKYKQLGMAVAFGVLSIVLFYVLNKTLL